MLPSIRRTKTDHKENDGVGLGRASSTAHTYASLDTHHVDACSPDPRESDEKADLMPLLIIAAKVAVRR